MSMPSSEERSKYASRPSSPRMNPQPIFLFSRVTEPRISVPCFHLRNFNFAATFCRHLRLSLRLRFSPSTTDALLRPLCQASLPEFDSSRAHRRKESESLLHATRTFGRALVPHCRHESCLSPGYPFMLLTPVRYEIRNRHSPSLVRKMPPLPSRSRPGALSERAASPPPATTCRVT